MNLCHFSVHHAEKPKFLKVTGIDRSVNFHSSPVCVVDSKYDVSRVRLSFEGALFGSSTAIAVHLVEGKPEENFGRVDIEIPIRTASYWMQAVIKSAGIAAGIATPSILALYESSSLDIWTGGIAAISSLMAGCVSVFYTRIG